MCVKLNYEKYIVNAMNQNITIELFHFCFYHYLCVRCGLKIVEISYDLIYYRFMDLDNLLN